MWDFMTLPARIPDAAGPLFRKPRLPTNSSPLADLVRVGVQEACGVSGLAALPSASGLSIWTVGRRDRSWLAAGKRQQ
jgi:hypothetical protein